MKELSEHELKRRTRRSFVTGAFGFAAGFLGLGWIFRARDDQGIAWPLRKVLRFNESIFSSLFSPNRRTPEPPRTVGKEPRVNGDIGLAELRSDWRVEVEGRKLTLEDIHKLPRTETSVQFKCIEGWSEEMTCAGTRFSDFLSATGLGKKADGSHYPYVGLSTPDEQYYVSIDMESMLHPQTLLCYEMNAMPLAFDNGAPLRLMIPVKYGIKSLKQIGRIRFSDTRLPDYWAERGYDWYAGL